MIKDIIGAIIIAAIIALPAVWYFAFIMTP